MKYKYKYKNNKVFVINSFNGCILCLVILSLLAAMSDRAFAASTPTNQLLKQIGSGAPTSWGDYISSSGGLNTYYSYYIEVPPNTGRLDILIFDADVGMGGAAAANDWTNDTFNTRCRYRVYTPTGSQAASVNGRNNAPANSNNNWLSIYQVNNPTIGHWEVRVDMSSTLTTDNDMNGYGIRAIDGVNGTELNIYAESFIPLGELGTGGTQTTTLYPYITSGCTVDSNDWDGDNGGSTLCTVSITSRTGGFTSSFNGSGSAAWLNNPLSGFTTDSLASDYGRWTSALSYTDTGANSNYGIFYLGSYNAANPPPTGQPQSDTFRIYFPTTSGGAPVKPFVTQNVSRVSGPNPPATGSTTRVRVAVSIFNPTPQSIAFSSSNLVTANVPGSGAVYAGNASVTQGTITAQPAVGGTGNIDWNPGSVAGSNNYETLYYEVDVTPTSPGQRIPVTGAPGSNGTTARYVDETGNTTQARATFTFGPLCALAATEGGGALPTLAVISSLAAYEKDGQVIVQWETAAEIAAVGFYLYRRDDASGTYRPLNESLLPGLLHSPQGGVYRFVDETALYGETYTYKLLEVEAKGNKRFYGPFTVTAGDGPQGMEPMQGAYSKEPHGPSLDKQSRLRERKQALATAGAPDNSPDRSGLKMAVKEKGLYYLGAAEIANVIGAPAPFIEASIRNHMLRLFNRDKEVSWLPDNRNPGIYFYGESIDSIYTDKNIYWLKTDPGSIMERVEGGSPYPAGGGATFRESLHFEEDRYTLTALFDDPEEDYWLWDFISAGTGKRFALQANGAAAPGKASLKIYLKGATDTPANPDHHAKVSLNGTEIGESRWDGTKAHTFTLSFNQSLLIDGENTVEVTGILDGGVSYSIFYVDSFDLKYDRYYRAVNGRLLCRGSAGPVITIEGFSDSNIKVFEITEPRRPKLVAGTTIDGAYRVSFKPSSPDSMYLALDPGGLRSPVAVTAGKPSSLKQKHNSADYLAIVPAGLKEAARDLAALRQDKGLETMVVELEDIYDEFNHGISNPWAIKDFLSYAYRKWNGNRPRFAVLVGEGTFDYKNNQGYGDNLVPPVLVKTPEGLFASDNLLGDVNGADGVPEIAVGRLPVATEKELRSLIGKISAYEDASGEWTWTGRVMMLADNPDAGGDFPTDSDYLAGLLPANLYTVEKIYLPDYPTINEAREKVLEGIADGALLVNYTGHAGLDRLAQEGLLRTVDVSALENGDRLPVVTAMTCVVGRFELPGYDSLSEVLVLKSNGGAAAVWAPSGASINTLAVMLAGEFFKAVSRDGEKILGSAVLTAMKRFAALGGTPTMLNIYNILGDPALEIK